MRDLRFLTKNSALQKSTVSVAGAIAKSWRNTDSLINVIINCRAVKIQKGKWPASLIYMLFTKFSQDDDRN